MRLGASERKLLIQLLNQEHRRLATPFGDQFDPEKNGRFRYIRTLIAKLNKTDVKL